MITNRVPVRPAARDRVYDVIDGECDYHDENDTPTDLAETLHRIAATVANAQKWDGPEHPGRVSTINHLRNIAALAARALERHGPIPLEYHVPASANITGSIQISDPGDRTAPLRRAS